MKKRNTLKLKIMKALMRKYRIGKYQTTFYYINDGHNRYNIYISLKKKAGFIWFGKFLITAGKLKTI